MKILYLTIAIVFVIANTALLWLAHCYDFNLYEFYSKKMQMPLFTGFLTLGGFLLTLKTFVLIKLKEGLYDHPNYKDKVRELRSLNPNYSYYGPLSRLGHFLIHSVLLALITSFYQFTLGFIQHNIIASIGITLALITVIVVLYAWWNIRQNLNYWFELLERENK